MSAKAAVTAAMALRPATAVQKFSAYAAMRDNDPLYFGNDGDVSATFSTTRNCLVIDGEGQGIDVKSPLVKDRQQLVEKFEKLPQLNASAAYTVNNQFEILGTNASDGDVTRGPEGGIICETDGGGNDQVIVLPHLVAGLSAWTGLTWGTDRSVRYDAVIGTGAAITDCIIWCGLKLTNTQVIATDNNQAFFEYSSAIGANWQTVYSIGGTDTQGDSAVVVAINTVYHFTIDISALRVARFFIDGVLVATSTALTDVTDLIPYIGVMDLGAAARHIHILQCSISRTIGVA
jgi:hypothetical protein